MNKVNKAHMSHDAFLRFVERNRGCEDGKLDAAVNKGLRRAKAQGGRVDSRKIFMLAAASVFTLSVCFTAHLRMFETASERYYRNRSESMPGAGAALEVYMKDIANTIETIAELGFRKNTLPGR